MRIFFEKFMNLYKTKKTLINISGIAVICLCTIICMYSCKEKTITIDNKTKQIQSSEIQLKKETKVKIETSAKQLKEKNKNLNNKISGLFTTKKQKANILQTELKEVLKTYDTISNKEYKKLDTTSVVITSKEAYQAIVTANEKAYYKQKSEILDSTYQKSDSLLKEQIINDSILQKNYKDSIETVKKTANKNVLKAKIAAGVAIFSALAITLLAITH